MLIDQHPRVEAAPLSLYLSLSHDRHTENDDDRDGGDDRYGDDDDLLRGVARSSTFSNNLALRNNLACGGVDGRRPARPLREMTLILAFHSIQHAAAASSRSHALSLTDGTASRARRLCLK